MQVEAPASSSSPLTSLSSLAPSSAPSVEAASTVAGSRAKVTYSRKPLAAEHDDLTRDSLKSSSPSSQPSPSADLFDSPMRFYGRNAPVHIDQDGNDVTGATESSPATTVPANNSAIKIGPSSLFRRTDSHPSQHISNDDDASRLSSPESPALDRTKKFNLGMARAIYDSDLDSDAGIDASTVPCNPTSKPLSIKEHSDDLESVRNVGSDPFTGSLSSVPPSNSQPLSSLHLSSHESGNGRMADVDQDGSVTITHRRGAKVSAMKGKGSSSKHSKFSSSSGNEASSASDEDDDHVQSRRPRTFKLVSSESSDPPMSTDRDNVDSGPSSPNATVPSRRERMDALAARARKAQGEVEDAKEATAQPDPLLDDFFGDASPARLPCRSPSFDIQQSDDDEHNDAMPAFMAAHSTTKTTSKTKSKKKKKKKLAQKERDILSDPEADFDRVNPNDAPKRATASTKDRQSKVKPLSKKEMENMHRQTARMARENRARLAPAQPKKTIGINELLSKIRTNETLRGTGAQPSDSASDTTLKSSSQIPSGQSKSQHASDPIESDPIPERSSPHLNYSSSPVVPMSRQQERRLGLDQSTGSASFLQHSAVGRLAGLATKQDHVLQSNQHSLTNAGSEDEDDSQLPDLASIVKHSRDQQEAERDAARNRQKLYDIKIRLLEQSRQRSSHAESRKVTVEPHSGQKPAQIGMEDQDDLEVYRPGSVLAAKHNLATTPAKKRPTDLLYREIGVRPAKTPPSRKSYIGTSANGSPGAMIHTAEDSGNVEGQDDLDVTDSQLRSAGKGLFTTTERAAGHVPVKQAQTASTQARHDDAHAHTSSTQGARRADPPKMTQAQLNATLMRKAHTQSLKARSQGGAQKASRKDATALTTNQHVRSAAPDVAAMLQRLSEAATSQGQETSLNKGKETDQDEDEDEDDPDYIMPPARDAESVIGEPIGSDVDMGSASEIEAAEEDQDLIDFGSAEEDDDDQVVDESGFRDTIEEADDDSEKENAPPRTSQQSQRSCVSPSVGRSRLPSRAVMDDDEDEMPAARPHVRRGRRSAVADDDDGDDEAEVDSLQPGPFDSSRVGTHAANAALSQGRPRVPLGDISSQSIDQSMLLSRSNTSSPAIQHAQPPGLAAAVRCDPAVVSLATGQFEDESFRTDDIPSQAADLGRFFEPTMPPPSSAAPPAHAASEAPKSFWDQTQTQTQTQSQSQSECHSPSSPSFTRAPQATDTRRELVRDESVNLALGAFFQETQQDELRGESLDIFDNPKIAGGKARGFTQFFFEGTPQPTGEGRGATGESESERSVWNASAMPPPKSTDVDAFAALRKAQMGEATDLLDPTPSVLPSFDESQAEREAYAQAQMVSVSPKKMYMNRDGFFTQTKPSQQVGLWSQYDTQSQSQSQPLAAVGASGVSPHLAASSTRRASDVSSAGGDQNASLSAQEEDENGRVQLKRLRRGTCNDAIAEDAAQQERQDHDDDTASQVDDQNSPPSSQPEPKRRNAFDVLRQGPLEIAQDERACKRKKRKSAYIEGEAEESEDDEIGGHRRQDGGGLKGVFADDNGSASEADDDEDDEDDADAADLQELVNNERELDEAEKDEVAHARYRADMEARDRENHEIAQKAIQGVFRNRRRNAGLNGIEGFLDQDADEEEFRRRAELGSRMSASTWKKRKLLDGTEDGLDALAAHEDAQAFVKAYTATHVIDHESERYAFLEMAADDQEEEDSNDEDEDMDDDDAAANQAEDHDEQGLAVDEFGPIVTKQPRTIGFKDVAEIVRERRKAKHRSAIDDDEGDDRQAHGDQANGWDSDDDNTEVRVTTALKDHTKLVATTQMRGIPLTATAHAKKKPSSSVQYGRKNTSAVEESHSIEAMDVDTQDYMHEHTPLDEADDDDVSAGSVMARLLSRGLSARQSCSLLSNSSLATADTLQDAEPEWGNDANIVRAPKPTAGGNGSQSSLRSSASKSLTFGTKQGDKSRCNERSAGQPASMLLSKHAIMRRESGFSSTSSRSS